MYMEDVYLCIASEINELLLTQESYLGGPGVQPPTYPFWPLKPLQTCVDRLDCSLAIQIATPICLCVGVYLELVPKLLRHFTDQLFRPPGIEGRVAAGVKTGDIKCLSVLKRVAIVSAF